MASGRPIYEFGPFRLDAGKRVLIRDGHAVPLTSKALDILLALVESHGELLEKDALISRVWPDTFVEEGNVTFNIHLLRKTLGDDRNNGNRFIETVPRRGYRFVAAVRIPSPEPAMQPGLPGQTIAENGSAPELSPVAHGRDARATARRGPRILAKVATVVAALIVIAVAIRFLAQPAPPPHVTGYRQLTYDARMEPAVVTDGLRVYFAREGQLYSVSVKGGEAVQVPTPFPVYGIDDISPDKSQLLITKGTPGHRSLWSLPLPGGTTRSCCRPGQRGKLVAGRPESRL
jgi:DNA-binding winged helix-turn-helix (wHTH) protein